MSNTLWSSIEIDILKDLYGKVSREVLEEALPDRKYSSIKLKASRLKLSNPDNNYRLINDTEYYRGRLTGLNIINLEPYIGSKKKIEHKCLVCNHEWKTSPDSIFLGSGCPNCNRRGGRCKNHPGYLYLIKVTTEAETFLKIGTTILDNNKRLNQLKTDISKYRNNVTISVLFKEYMSGSLADSLELQILKKYPRYTTPFEFSGYTELINIEYLENILELLHAQR